eukprot:TRINITY_DN12719_c0_g1_i1.p1 TRINITY_DN12719_c0_g1~~TRINITY_DN12719_c0_g1_i1.p1  ORF type:complete len:110 (+),score=23.86 TRINITY_DN12719_c0_g1_i1:370-699(+)
MGELIGVESVEKYADKRQTLMGPVAHMDWSDNGQRLAVSFLESELIAIYKTDTNPWNITPLGYVRGPPTQTPPHIIAFRPHFPRGALLASCWDNGKIAFCPMYDSAVLK